MVMKLKDIMGYIAGDCTISVEDATNEEFKHVEDFTLNDKDKMEIYKNAQVTGILPYSKDCIQINVCIN